MMIILEDADFTWDYPVMLRVAGMWAKEMSIRDIAKEVDRDIDEVFLLLLHLSREGKIKARSLNIWGKGVISE